MCLTTHNWQKWKSTFLTCHCHEIYREEAVGLTSSKYDFWEYGKFGAISLKNDILSITAQFRFESKSSFVHMWHMLLWLSDAHHISFLLNRFSVKYRFLFPILRFLPQNHLTLLKDRFLKKLLLKRAKAKTRRFFFRKTIGSNNSFTLIEHNFNFF